MNFAVIVVNIQTCQVSEGLVLVTLLKTLVTSRPLIKDGRALISGSGLRASADARGRLARTLGREGVFLAAWL